MALCQDGSGHGSSKRVVEPRTVVKQLATENVLTVDVFDHKVEEEMQLVREMLGLE